MLGCPNLTCLGDEAWHTTTVYEQTYAHSRPHALENRQIYQTKVFESSGTGPGLLGRMLLPSGRRTLLLAAGRLQHALCRGQADGRTSHDAQVTSRVSRVSNKVRFPPQVSGAQAKATACRTRKHIHKPLCVER